MEKESVKKFDLEAAFKALDEIEIPVAEKGIRANRVDLRERFQHKSAHEELIEDYYDVSSGEDLTDAQEERKAEVAQAKLARIEKIVDLDADTAEDLLPSYVGKVIIQCPQCMTLFYKNPEDIEHSDENPDVVNINEICQHCGNASGYTLIGKVDSVNADEADNYPEEPAGEKNELDLNFEEPTKEVDAEGTGEGAKEMSDENELSDDELKELDLDLEEIPEEESEDEKKEESLNLSKELKDAEEGSELKTENESKNLTLNEKVVKLVKEDYNNENLDTDLLDELVDKIPEDIRIDLNVEANPLYGEGDGIIGAILFNFNFDEDTVAKATTLVNAVISNLDTTKYHYQIWNPEAPSTEGCQSVDEVVKAVTEQDEFYAFYEDNEYLEISIYENEPAVEESLNNSEVQKEAEKGSDLKTENESENLTLNEEIDKDLDKRLKEHNDYIAYLQQMIKQEEEALKKADNEEVKAAIQRSLDAFNQDLQNALPDAVKNEPEVAEAAVDEPTEEIPEEEPKAEEEAPAEDQLTEDAVEKEKSAEDNEVNYVEYKHSYCHALEPKLKAINYLVNVKKVEPRILKGYILKLLKDPEIKWTEKEKEFKKNIEAKEDNQDILDYVKNSVEKAKELKVKVDENGELVEALTESLNKSEAAPSEHETENGSKNLTINEDISSEIDSIIASWGDVKEGLNEEGNLDAILDSPEFKKPVSEAEIDAARAEVENESLKEDNNLNDPDNIEGIIQEWGDAAEDDKTASINKTVANNTDKTQVSKDDNLDHIFNAWESLKEDTSLNDQAETDQAEDKIPADGKAVLPKNIKKQLTENIKDDADAHRPCWCIEFIGAEEAKFFDSEEEARAAFKALRIPEDIPENTGDLVLWYLNPDKDNYDADIMLDYIRNPLNKSKDELDDLGILENLTEAEEANEGEESEEAAEEESKEELPNVEFNTEEVKNLAQDVAEKAAEKAVEIQADEELDGEAKDRVADLADEKVADAVEEKVEAEEAPAEEAEITAEEPEFNEDDIDELDECSLNKHIDEYLQEVYSNVKSYKTTDCEFKEGKLIVEGKISFKSGKEKLTMFEFLPAYDKGKLFFEGYNKDFSEGKAFTLNCSINESKTLITESFGYKYKINENLVEGLK